MAQDKNLTRILQKSRREAEERDAERRAKELGSSYINLATQPVETDALELIPEEIARTARVAAIEKKGDRVVLVAADLSAPEVIKTIQELEAKSLRLSLF